MTSQFDWSQFEKVAPAPKQATQQAPEQGTAEQKPPQQETFDWSQFQKAGEVQAAEKGSALKRHTARTGARVGETIAGLPGDILALPGNVAKFVASKVSPKAHKDVSMAADIARAILPGGGAPTSGEIRQQTKQVSGGYLEPQTKAEQIGDEFVSDFISLAIPVKGKVPFANALARALGISAAGTAASEGVGLLGAGEGGREWAKTGATFLGSMFNPKGATKYVSGLYEEAKNLLPQGASAPATHLSGQLSSLKQQLHKGGSAPSKTKAIQKIDEVQAKISKGRIPVDELTEFKKSINEARSGLYEEFKSDKVGRKMAKKNLDAVSKSVDGALQEYGKSHPEWAKSYNAANEGFGAIAKSKKIRTNAARFLKQHPHVAYGGLGSALFSLTAPHALVGAAAGAAALGSIELYKKISSSPVLRKYYTQAVQSAAKEDAASFAKNMEKLDSKIKSEE